MTVRQFGACAGLPRGSFDMRINYLSDQIIWGYTQYTRRNSCSSFNAIEKNWNYTVVKFYVKKKHGRARAGLRWLIVDMRINYPSYDLLFLDMSLEHRII